MSDKQQTIKERVELRGYGLHSGQDVKLTFVPAPVDQGIIFKRTDIEGSPTVHAIAENVKDTSRGTNIAENGVEVKTIEHIMASAYALGLDNLTIEMDGPEAPIDDGSSKVFITALTQTGLKEQNKYKNYFELTEKYEYVDKETGVKFLAIPDDHFSLQVMIDYNSQVLGNQFAVLEDMADFQKEVAPARTFVFLHELESLLKAELIKGGDLENAIVIIDREVSQQELDRLAKLFNKPSVKVKPQGILNNLDLYYQNEPARHKLLDLIGDLALIGMPMKARIIASKPGHTANNKFARLLRQKIKTEKAQKDIPKVDLSAPPVLDIKGIRRLLPHRPPFLLIDKVMELGESHVVGIKNVTMNEPFFVGHFPREPIMPGVLIVEAMAQAAGILALNPLDDPEKYLTLFLKIENVKFKQMVVPGDTLILKCELSGPIRRGVASIVGRAYVNGKVATEAELMAQITKMNK